MRSPFKFLDAYTLADKEVFFGRTEEVEELYEMVFKSPLVLVYGMSGTGKTSMIQCGLASRFDGPDWFPIAIRRNDNINDSIKATMGDLLGDNLQESLADNVSYLFRYYLRPVYFIFDQLEELFILGSREEQQQFVVNLRKLLDAELPCNIILVMREEYIGHLYHFEKVLPTIFDFRLRVEPMKNQRVEEVMMQSFEKFNIKLEPTEKERCEQMIDYLSSGKSGIQLPYLQVYLDTLYREVFAEKYGAATAQELQPILFTKSKIDGLGTIEEVLEKFLMEQEIRIQQLVAEREAVDTNFVRNLLDLFVTEDGTKQPIPFTREDESVAIPPKFQGLLPPVSKSSVSIALKELERSRIVRFGDTLIELAHDSLAALIDQKRTDEQRQLNEIKRRIRNAYLEYIRSDLHLNKRQLQAYEEFLPLLSLKTEEWDFIEASREYVRKKEEEAELQRKKEERQKQERKFTAFMTLLAILAVALGVTAFQQKKEADRLRLAKEEQRKEAERLAVVAEGRLDDLVLQTIKTAESEFNRHLEKADGFKQNLEFEAAKKEIIDAKNSISEYEDNLSKTIGKPFKLSFPSIDEADPMLSEVESLLARLPGFNFHKNKGERLWSNKQYEEALRAFQVAKNTGIFSVELNENMEKAREQGIAYYKELGHSHFQSGTIAGHIVSNDFFKKAIRMGDNDENTVSMISINEEIIKNK